ncbi:MAG TPA: BlaI/MecI/CopY family transcriptional regulator [Tepidisphaeraceae bacterium]|nr:BlaI/MecI/CopY family transcriptional regulator [Tepidisphaeraceae bacterium]
MAREKSIGRAELEVLQFINDRHPATVREVADHFADTRGHVRTTALNVMRRLCDKRYLTRRKAGGVYRYKPRLSKGQLLRSLIHNFVAGALGGSLSPFVAYLAEDPKLSAEDIDRLRRIVRDLERK